MIPHVNFYRRHLKDCPAHHPQNLATNEVDERRMPPEKRCLCLIYASGTLAGVFRRVATHEHKWDKAREVVQPFVNAGSWTARSQPPPPSGTPSGSAEKGDRAHKTLLTDAIQQCLGTQQANQAADTTLAKYRTVLLGKGGLAEFAAANGLRYVEEWTPRLTRLLSNSWPVGLGTRRTKLSVIKPFFEQLVEDGVISTNPARIRQVRNRAMRMLEEGNCEREAYSDRELRRMIEGCRNYGLALREWPQKKDGRVVVVPITQYRDYARKFDGEDLADFIELSYSTGMRCMDVATFHISRLTEHGEIKIRTQKNGNWICVRVSSELQKVIRERARIHGPYIFGDPTGRKPHNVYLCWQRRLEKLWAETGPWERKPVHHRFRHTFVRLLLERQTDISVVAALIGDSTETVRKHYSNWVPELQHAVNMALEKVQAYIPQLRRGL